MQNTTKKPDRLGQLISQLSETTNAAAGTKLFANKSDLEAAQARIKQLEQENQALRTRPLALTPTKAASTPAKVSPAPVKASTTAQDWQPKPKPQISKQGFDALTPSERMEFIKQGGKISN